MTINVENPVPRGAESRGHEHGWRIESCHPTSMGRILYVRCAECGTRRVDVQGRPDAVPSALSAEIGAGRRPL